MSPPIGPPRSDGNSTARGSSHSSANWPRTSWTHQISSGCASRLYGEGIGLAAIQQLLGHRWLSTTVRYVHVADEAIENAYEQAAERAAARFKE